MPSVNVITWFTCALCPPNCTYEGYNRSQGTGVPFRKVERVVREAFHLPECVDDRWRVCETHYRLALSGNEARYEGRRNDHCPVCTRTVQALWRPLTDAVRQAGLGTGVSDSQLPRKSDKRTENPTCCIECFTRTHPVPPVPGSISDRLLSSTTNLSLCTWSIISLRATATCWRCAKLFLPF
jgi:hypothetical protein